MSPEIEIREFLESLGLKVHSNETDSSQCMGTAIIPDEHISIQYMDEVVDRDAIIYRSVHCISFGYRLIIISHREWACRKEAVKARLHVTFHTGGRIHANRTSIVQLSEEEARLFLYQYHPQSYPRDNWDGTDHTYTEITNTGLKTKSGDLVAVLCMGKDDVQFYGDEILSYTTKGTVIGGAKKLFDHHIITETPKMITADCNLSWDTGGLYYFLNFKPEYLVEGTLAYPLGWQKFTWHPEGTS